jgi:hypothetical protein
MGARVDQTRNTYYIPDFYESDDVDSRATVEPFPEDWPEDTEEWPFCDDNIASYAKSPFYGCLI